MVFGLIKIKVGLWKTLLDKGFCQTIIISDCGKLMAKNKKQRKICMPEVQYRKMKRDRERLLKIKAYIQAAMNILARI